MANKRKYLKEIISCEFGKLVLKGEAGIIFQHAIGYTNCVNANIHSRDIIKVTIEKEGM